MFNEDGTLSVTYNGEIYNYIELREELKNKGHVFRTKSDTEVIVHAFEEWGAKCPLKFNGQFAFAIFDSKQQRLFLCRDRIGVRPLHYAVTGGVFVFASEVKALFASGFVDPVISPRGMNQTFRYWSNLFNWTSFEGVHELPPAHSMFVSRKGCDLNRYWEFIPTGNLDRNVEALDLLQKQEELLDLLKRSVRLRLRADVPVAAYLSGGLDSALLTALIRRETNSSLKTFSVEFEDSRYDESIFQQEMVKHLGTEHTAFRCTTEDIVMHFEDAIRAAERPIVRTAPVPMLLLSGLVRSEGYKVVVTGEGADEFFLGYDIYKEVKIRQFIASGSVPSWRAGLLRRLYPYLFTDPRTSRFQEAFFLQRYRETADPFYGHRLRWETGNRIKEYYTPDFRERLEGDDEMLINESLPSVFINLSSIERTQVVEIATLLSGYLLSSQGDRVSMANSVEGRFAFLDSAILEFSSRLPSHIMMSGLNEKTLLKKIGATILPANVLHRKKYPYRAPDIECFLTTKNGKKLLAEEFEEGRLARTGIFDSGKINRLLLKVSARPDIPVTRTENMVLMSALASQMFYRIFIEEKPVMESFRVGDKIKRYR